MEAPPSSSTLPIVNGHDPDAALLIEEKRQKQLARHRAYYALNKEKYRADNAKRAGAKKAWALANIDHVRAQRSRPEVRAKKNGSRNEKYRTDPAYREREQALARANYEKHRETRIAGVKAYYERTRDKGLADRRRYYQAHKEDFARWQAEWNAKNPDKRTAYSYAWLERNREDVKARQLVRYGLTHERYLEILIEQNGVCAICKRPEVVTKKRTGRVLDLCVDHDHKTGKVRGLLCNNCNWALGLLGDEPAAVFAAWKYLLQQNKAALKVKK